MASKNIFFLLFWILMSFIIFKSIPPLLKKDNFRLIEGVIRANPNIRKCGKRDRNTCLTFQIEGFHFKEIAFTTNKLKLNKKEVPLKKGDKVNFHILKDELTIKWPVTIHSMTVNDKNILALENRLDAFKHLMLGLFCLIGCVVFLSNPE